MHMYYNIMYNVILHFIGNGYYVTFRTFVYGFAGSRSIVTRRLFLISKTIFQVLL